MAKFDETRVNELLAIFGAGDLAMVLDAFLEEAEQAVAGLGRLLSEAPDRVRDQQLDYLARAAMNMGASGFADLCRSYERAGQFQATDHNAVRQAFRQTCDAFNLRVQSVETDAA